jgi:hypothetical protein
MENLGNENLNNPVRSTDAAPAMHFSECNHERSSPPKYGTITLSNLQNVFSGRTGNDSDCETLTKPMPTSVHDRIDVIRAASLFENMIIQQL